jgi:hypothetical protein
MSDNLPKRDENNVKFCKRKKRYSKDVKYRFTDSDGNIWTSKEMPERASGWNGDCAWCLGLRGHRSLKDAGVCERTERGGKDWKKSLRRIREV